MPSARAVDPIPEAQQAALATQILNAYHETHIGTAPRKLQVVYFTPSDRDPEPLYRERLEAILEDIRAFYRDGMTQAGFGPKTFDFARDAGGKLIIHLVKGSEPDAAYLRSGFGQLEGGDAIARRKIIGDSRASLAAAGISFDRETVLMFCNLASWNEKERTFRHHSPFLGYWNQTDGWCFALDSVILDMANLPRREPMLHDAEWGDESLGKFNTVFIGGLAHEIGHAFSLPHCGERWDEKRRGKSLMGFGNHNYRSELRGESPGAFLTMASAMKLAAHPLFARSDPGKAPAPRLDESELQLSTQVSRRDLANRAGALRVEGTVKGTPPVYGVIAYFDSLRDGGYGAPTATSVPDAEGHFAIEVSDLAPSRDAELRLEYCHANGVTSQDRAAFQVTPNGSVDLSQWLTRKTLLPLGQAVSAGNLSTARSELDRIEKSASPELAKTIARKLVATLQEEPKPVPANTPPGLMQLPLGDAHPQAAEVGWLTPAANRIPPNNEISSPLLDAGTVYATGLFAHAPSRYVFDLGGQWKTLRGGAGLHTSHQPYGAVVFVIKADGGEVFRSPIIRGSAKASYQIDVTGRKTLELIVEPTAEGKANAWGLWLDPILFRN
jgi:hypothetical protein